MVAWVCVIDTCCQPLMTRRRPYTLVPPCMGLTCMTQGDKQQQVGQQPNHGRLANRVIVDDGSVHQPADDWSCCCTQSLATHELARLPRRVFRAVLNHVSEAK